MEQSETTTIKTWDLRLAKFVSDVLSPPVVSLSGLFLVASLLPEDRAWYWTGIFILMTIIVPLAYLLFQIRAGKVSSFHMPIREQRYPLMRFVVVMTAFCWYIMWRGDAPYALTLFAGVGIFQTIMMLVITTMWKISAHATAISGMSIFIVTFFGWVAWPALLMIPLVSWARIRTHSHSMLQTLAGSLAGASFIFIVMMIIATQCNGIGFTCG